MTIDAPLDARPVGVPVNGLLTSPILPTLLRLALPNTVAMFGSTLVAVAETSYIGRLGIEPLAAIALVFPFAMLTQMMSAGAMGGGVSSAISRALGAGDRDRAATLALHAAIIGACGGLFFTVMMLPSRSGWSTRWGRFGHRDQGTAEHCDRIGKCKPQERRQDRRRQQAVHGNADRARVERGVNGHASPDIQASADKQ